MGKLVTIMCESMIRHDLGTEKLPGFVVHDLDMRPSRLSATTLYLMQTDDQNVPYMYTKTATSFFDEPRGFISLKYKTRLISNYWPRRFDPRSLDPLATIDTGQRLLMEPKSHHWPVLIDFLRKFGGSDYLWCIYWPLIGHEGYGLRLPEESSGMPDSLAKTTSLWLGLVREHILPLVPQEAAVMVHSDHGTARGGLGELAYVNGFLLSRGIDLPDRTLTWQDVRDAERKVLER